MNYSKSSFQLGKKWWGTLMFITLFIGAIQAQSKKGGEKEFKLSNTLLYKIEKDGMSPSYLFGTMHLLCPEEIKLDSFTQKAILESKTIYLEIDMDDMKEMMGMMSIMAMKNGTKLKDLYTAEEYERVKAHFNKNKTGIPFQMMEGFKPMLISSLLIPDMMGCQATEGMESIIMKTAKSQQKEIKGLETVAFQGSVFDSIPYKKQAADLLKYIDSPQVVKKTFIEMKSAYLKGDLKALENQVEGDPSMAEMENIMLKKRNESWVDQMPAIMDAEPTFFAVGAAHLVGKYGVLKMLKQQGYTVTAVTADDPKAKAKTKKKKTKKRKEATL